MLHRERSWFETGGPAAPAVVDVAAREFADAAPATASPADGAAASVRLHYVPTWVDAPIEGGAELPDGLVVIAGGRASLARCAALAARSVGGRCVLWEDDGAARRRTALAELRAALGSAGRAASVVCLAAPAGSEPRQPGETREALGLHSDLLADVVTAWRAAATALS